MIDEAVVRQVLRAALRSGGEFAEVFAEDRSSSSARLDDNRIEEFTSGRERGAGIRVVRGDTTGFAHTSDLTERGLLAAAEAAGAAARAGGRGENSVALDGEPRPERGRQEAAMGGSAFLVEQPRPVSARVLPGDVPKAQKADLLLRANDAARSEGAEIRQVSVSYYDGRRQVLVANSDGVFSADDQVRTRLLVRCVAAGSEGMQTSLEAPGRTVGFELYDELDVEEVARQAARRALRMLKARPAPAGRLPVVLKRGAGGVLFHEACGHGLEADLVAKDASVFRGRVGDTVASPLVTVVDDGTYAREWGTSAVDDEGRAVQRNTLIEGGELTSYMWDLLRARGSRRESSGNGRRQSYQHLPMVRMTNTYVLPGEEDPDEIVRQTPHGIYCAQLGGGQVNTATGDFVFGMTEAYMIENGEITYPVRSANLIGNGPEILTAVDAVGNDFDTWTGTCGKDGQSVPVSAGQPTLRVVGITVGGTKTSQ